MKKVKKANQRLLQAAFGIGLILFVVLIELMAVHPAGIYSYTRQGYKEFKIGVSKAAILKKINKQKSIRSIRVCDPDGIVELKSRRLFKLKENLASSNYWICHDRTGKILLFVFKDETLDRILLQRFRSGRKEASVLFAQCRLELLEDIDTYLDTQETLTVYRDSSAKK